MTRVLLVAAVLFVQACAVDDECGTCDTSERGTHGGDTNPCTGEPVSAALDWTTESERGSPADVFGPAEGSCEAEFTWDGSAFDDRSVEPRAGRTRVMVELVVDHASARRVEQRPRQGLSPTSCRSYLEVDGHVTIETVDGVFRTQGDVTLRHLGNPPPLIYEISQGIAEQAGSLSVALHDDESGTLQYRIDGSGVCAGEISLNVGGSRGNMGWFGGGRIARWSDSACPLGQTPFDLSASRDAAGRTLPVLIEELWNDATYPGKWRDGTNTELMLGVEVTATTACNEQGSVVVPLQATYATSDGRIRPRTVDATVRARVREDGSPAQLDLWLTDDLVCANERDTLDYTRADCAELEQVTLQLGFNYYGIDAPAVTSGGLHVYIGARGGGEPPAGDVLEL